MNEETNNYFFGTLSNDENTKFSSLELIDVTPNDVLVLIFDNNLKITNYD